MTDHSYLMRFGFAVGGKALTDMEIAIDPHDVKGAIVIAMFRIGSMVFSVLFLLQCGSLVSELERIRSKAGTGGSVAPLPIVTSASPGSGSTTGGITVTISGANFDGASAVTFGGTAATSFTLLSAGQISAVTPAHPGGIFDVSVTTTSGTGTLTNGFRYIISQLSGKVSTLAGSTAGLADGTGTAAQFNSPYGIAADSFGNLYLADAGNNCVRKITQAGVVTTIAGSGTPAYADGVGTAASFNAPNGVAVDSTATTLYISDSGNNRIRKITLSTGTVTTLAGTGVATWVDGSGNIAAFNGPNPGMLDSSGNLYIADVNNNRIRKIDTATGFVSTLAGNTSSGTSNGTGAGALFFGPRAVSIDPTGTILYVGDFYNNMVRKIVISSALVSTPAGIVTAGYVDGAGATARFNGPVSTPVDLTNTYIYVTDFTNHRIRRIDVSTNIVSSYAGTGVAGSTDGAINVAQFNNPKGMIFDASGIAYVVDTGNNRIRKIE